MENTKADVQTKAEGKKEIDTEVILQYREYEVNMDDVTERVKAHYLPRDTKRTPSKTCRSM